MTARHFSLLKRIWLAVGEWWEDLPLYAYALLIILAITVVWLLLVRLFGLGLWCIAYCLVVLIALG